MIYANIMMNFFNNLNNKTIKELKLTSGKITLIKNDFKPVEEIRNAIRFQTSSINEEYYKNFKTELRNKFPDFVKPITEIEFKI